VDVVLLLPLSRLPELMAAALELGLVPRIADPERFARKSRVVLLRHEESGIGEDISLGILPFEEELVFRSRLLRFGDLELRLPTPEDLIIMKAVAHRPKDLLDIEGIALANPGLDLALIEAWVRQFAEALEMPVL
jgi:hypothetical protein